MTVLGFGNQEWACDASNQFSVFQGFEQARYVLTQVLTPQRPHDCGPMKFKSMFIYTKVLIESWLHFLLSGWCTLSITTE